MRTEFGPVFGDLHDRRQAEKLKSAAVGQDRAVPAHESVQAAQLFDDPFARPQGKMIGVRQNHFGAGGAKLLDLQPLDRGLRADRHEGRQLHRAVRSAERRPPGLRTGVDMVQFERKSGGSMGQVLQCSRCQ